MPVFTYEARNRAGKRVMGERAAASRDQVIQDLRRAQLGQLRVMEKVVTGKGRKVNVTAKELAVFFRQFSVMIDAGLPLVQCLDLIAGNQENAGFARALNDVRSEVEGGSTLANAMRHQPRVFDGLTCNMIEAGETGGILDTILQRLSVYVEKAVKLRAAVKSAMIYPVSVISFATLIVFFLLWKIVPIFVGLFNSLNATLPLPTKIVIDLSHFVSSFWWLILGSPVIFVVVVKRLHATEDGRLWLDRMTLKLPIIGIVLRKIAIARFARTLGTLISSGVSILEALDITARTSGNALVEQSILKVRLAIEQGRTIIDPLRESGIFPNMVVQMIGVGEQTGALDAMLQKIGDFYEDEVDAASKNLLALLEPLMIGVLGFTVGGIVISMYMPMFSLIQQMAQQAH